MRYTNFMADEQEQQEARDKHDATLKRLRDLRAGVDERINQIIDANYNYPPDLIYEREERERIRDDLRNVQRRIHETIDEL